MYVLYVCMYVCMSVCVVCGRVADNEVVHCLSSTMALLATPISAHGLWSCVSPTLAGLAGSISRSGSSKWVMGLSLPEERCPC